MRGLAALGSSRTKMGGVWSHWWLIPISIACGMSLVWAAVLVALCLAKPDEVGVRHALRLLPDMVRLLKRLASDSTMPRGVRVRLALLLGYLALPIDLIPDFVPILGYADDAIIVALVLRSVTRRAGPDAVAKHWPGTPDGLAAVCRLCRIPGPD
jgi:uncharacterized membrane protein YkvA (DUF1232 family)